MSRLLFPILVALSLAVSACTPVVNVQDTPTSTTAVTLTSTATATSTITPTRTNTPRPAYTMTPVPVLPTLRTPETRDALPSQGTVAFQILHWNDFHGELGERTYGNEWLPGAARLAYVVKNAEKAYGPERTLILDAGDFFQGSPNTGKTGGLKVLEFYQRLGVDAITVGNHEFFSGVGKFLQILSKASPIEILSANLRKWGLEKSCSDNPIVSAYKIFELGEANGPVVRVAVIGAGRRFLEVESYSTIIGICFSKPGEEILKIYDQLVEMEKPDVIVVLSHSGLTDDRMLAEELNAAGKPVDIIIGGHGHTLMESPEIVGSTTIVQVGDFGRAVGIFDLAYDRSTSRLKINWRKENVTPCTPQDLDTLAFLKDTVSTPTPNPNSQSAVRDPSNTYLIDMHPSQATIGYWTLGLGRFPAYDSGMAECQVITSHQKEYPFGLFAHASSEIHYSLGGKFSHFNAEISIKETACGDGAEFVVALDGKEIYHSPWMTAASKPVPLILDVSGGDDLVLSTLGGQDISCDWTIWGDPFLTK